MQQSCAYGSVRGASGNRRPYRDKTTVQPVQIDHPKNAPPRIAVYAIVLRSGYILRPTNFTSAAQ